MKRIFTILGIIAAPILSTAQTITQADFPIVGETWVEQIDTNSQGMFPITAAGTAQMWNYSTSFNVNHTGGAAFIAPSMIPNGVGSNYPNSTLAVYNSSDSSSEYFKSQTNGLYLDGIYSPAGITQGGVTIHAIDFNPDQMYFPAPFTINNTASNTSAFAFLFDSIVGPLTVHIKVKASFVASFNADASGSLVTPFGSYSNTLRVKKDSYEVDSIFTAIGGTPPYNYALQGTPNQHGDTTLYYWVQPASHFLIMEAACHPNTTNVVRAGYYDAPPMVTGISDVANATITSYPNPANDIVNIALSGNEKQLDIYDFTGKLIYSQNITGIKNTILNINQYNNGMYLMRITDNSGTKITTKQFSVVK